MAGKQEEEDLAEPAGHSAEELHLKNLQLQLIRLSLRIVQENMKLLFISLGCDKNLVDSEEMLGMLAGNGHEIVDDEDEAEVIVVNTCCFIGDAKEESVNTILEMAEKKKAGTCKVLIVTGCMAQRYKEEISEEIPEVDAILGQPLMAISARLSRKPRRADTLKSTRAMIFFRIFPGSVC